MIFFCPLEWLRIETLEWPDVHFFVSSSFSQQIREYKLWKIPLKIQVCFFRYPVLVYANYGAIKTRNVSTSLGGRRACFKTSAFITKNVPNWISNASIVTRGPDPPDVRGAGTTVLIGINKLKSSHKFSFSSRKSQRKKIRKILFLFKRNISYFTKEKSTIHSTIHFYWHEEIIHIFY